MVDKMLINLIDYIIKIINALDKNLLLKNFILIVNKLVKDKIYIFFII